METKTLKDLITNEVKGTTFASLDTVTDVKLKGGKKNPFQGRVQKVVTGSNVMLFANTQCNGYESMVKRRMVSEGKDPETFTVGKRAWGERVDNSPFIRHNEKDYFEVFFISPGTVEYLVDGEVFDKSEIEGLEDTKKKVSEESQGGIEEKVVIRTFSMDSIKKVRIKGRELS